MEEIEQLNIFRKYEKEESAKKEKDTTINSLSPFDFYNEIKNLEKILEEWEEKRKSYIRLMFKLSLIGTSAGLAFALGIAFYYTLESFTIQSFLNTFFKFDTLKPIFAAMGLTSYYVWAIATTEYKEEKEELNIASLKLHFLKKCEERITREELNVLYEKLAIYGEKIKKYAKKYNKGKWGMEERKMLIEDNINPKIFESFLEEYTRTRKRNKEDL